MKNMGVKADIPFGVAIEGIKLGERRILPLITPREASILEVHLLQHASLEGVTEPDDATPVDVAVVLVLSPPNLVEVPKDQPANACRWLEVGELGKEIIFAVRRRRAIDGGDHEVTLLISVDDVDHGRKRELRSGDVSQLHHGIVPQN